MGWSMPGGTSRDEILSFVEAAIPAPTRSSKSCSGSAPTPCRPVQRARSLLQDAHGPGSEIGDAKLDNRGPAPARFTKGASGTWVAGCRRADGSGVRDASPEGHRHLAQTTDRWPPAPRSAAYRHGLRRPPTLRTAESSSCWSPCIRCPAVQHPSARGRRSVRELTTKHDSYPLRGTSRGTRTTRRHFVAFNDRRACRSWFSREARGKLFDDHRGPGRPTDGAPWLAAYWALRLKLPGAQDAVAERLRHRGGVAPTRWRGSVFDDIRIRTLDAFVADHPTDSRWTVALLDGDIEHSRARAVSPVSTQANARSL